MIAPATEREVEMQGQLRNADGLLLSKAGQTVDCLVCVEVVETHGPPVNLWIFQDIIQRRRSEPELVQAIDEMINDASWLRCGIQERQARKLN